jgi:hypothetical protein
MVTRSSLPPDDGHREGGGLCCRAEPNRVSLRGLNSELLFRIDAAGNTMDGLNFAQLSASPDTGRSHLESRA